MEGSVYLKARREWDERYADLVLGKRNRWNVAVSLALVVARTKVAAAETNQLE